MDPAAPEIKVTVQEAATFTSTAPEKKFAPKSKDQAERQKKWREQKDKGVDPKSIFAEMRESAKEVKFSSSDAEHLKTKWGSGHAEIDPSKIPPEAILDGKESPTERLSFENASQRIDEANAFVQYSEILAESKKTGKTTTQIIDDRVARGDVLIDYGKTREKALDALLSNSAVKNLFPDINSYRSPDAKRDYVEALIALDPQVRNKVATALKEIGKSDLPEIVIDEEVSKAEEENAINKPKLDVAKDDVVNDIKADLKNPPLTQAQEDQIRKYIDDGNPPEAVVRYAHRLVINRTNVDKYDSLTTIYNKQIELAQRNQMLATTTKAAERTTLQAEISKLNDEFRGLMASNSVTQTELQDFSDLLIRYTDQKDAGNIYVSAIAQRASEGSQLSKSIKENDDLLKRKGPEVKKKEQRDRNNRLRAEADLQDKLDNLITSAVIDTVEARYEEAVTAEGELLKEEAEKTGTEDDKLVVNGMNVNFLEYNPKTQQKIPHKDNINSGMRLAAYEGDDGIKRLMLRDLKITTKKDGTPFDYRYDDISDLTDEQKARLEKVYTNYGNKYRDRLFKDAFASETLGDKLKNNFVPGTHRFGLRSHEWQLLGEKFAGKLVESLAKSKEGSAILKNLEAQGIKPDFKMKWLLYILLGLGLAVPGAAFLGVGGAIGAGAVGLSGAAEGIYGDKQTT